MAQVENMDKPRAGTLVVGDPIYVYSGTGGGWMPGAVKHVHDKGITAWYEIEGTDYTKHLDFGTPNLRVPPLGPQTRSRLRETFASALREKPGQDRKQPEALESPFASLDAALQDLPDGEKLQPEPRAAPAAEVDTKSGRPRAGEEWWYWRSGRTWVPYPEKLVTPIENAWTRLSGEVVLSPGHVLLFIDPQRDEPAPPHAALELCRMAVPPGTPPERMERLLRGVSYSHLAKTNSPRGRYSEEGLTDAELEMGGAMDRSTQMQSMKGTAEELGDCAPAGGWLFRIEEEDYEEVVPAQLLSREEEEERDTLKRFRDRMLG